MTREKVEEIMGAEPKIQASFELVGNYIKFNINGEEKVVSIESLLALSAEPCEDMTREEAEKHAKGLKEFCRDRDNLDEPCEDCPFHFYDGFAGVCVFNYGLYPSEWFKPQESEGKE